MIRIRTDVPAALAAMRASREETRRSLAKDAGMTEQQYGAYERGGPVPSLATLVRLADAADHEVILVPREVMKALADLRTAIPPSLLTLLTLIPREDAQEPTCQDCGGPCRDESALEDA